MGESDDLRAGHGRLPAAPSTRAGIPGGVGPPSALLLVLALVLPGGLPAQAGAPLELSVAPRRTSLLSFHLGDILTESSLREALEAGLPLRIVVAVELWEDKLFDSQEGRTDWRATVVHDPLSGEFRLRTSAPRATDETLATLEETRMALQRTVRVALRPDEEGRYYYTGILEVQTFSASDLEELQRWLRGELAPAVAGEGNVDDALGEGMRRLLVRLLGLPTRKYRTRTPTFQYRPPAEGSR